MRVFACILALGLVASPVMAGAGAPGESDSSSSAPATSASASSKTAPAATAPANAAPAKPEPSSLELSNEIQQLRDLIESQSAQIQTQNDQLKAQQEKMLELQSQMAASPTADVLAANALTAAVGPATGTLATSAEGSGQEPHPPTSISYKGITLTPGGFFAAEGVWRSKALAADVNTPFNSAPFDGASAARTSEFNASGRQSRISMLVEGKLDNVKIGGYYEMDFLSAGTTSNDNQSNSYTARQRQFWGQAAFNNGFTFTGGQQWSLITETAKGMDNRTENLPMTIDAQYHVGFSWARQLGFRVTKSLLDNKVFLGFAVEESQSTLTVHGNPTAQAAATPLCTNAGCTTTTTININPTFNNFLLGAFGTSGGLYNPAANYAFNLAPDLVFKAVFEPGFGHYEVFGILSQFRDRTFPCVPITGTAVVPGCTSITSAAFATNNGATGGGVGANARWALLNKKVDLGIHFLGGDGIGRYGSGGLSDATTRPDGTLALLRNYQTLGTLQLHPVPKLDIYMNVGGEFTNRAEYTKSGVVPNEGYGAVGFANSGCWTETLPVTGPSTSSNIGVPSGIGGGTGFIPGPLGSCTGDTRRLVEGTIGFWYRFYNGPKGRFQWGGQYSNYIRSTFSGTAATLPDGVGSSGQPHSDENMVFTSFRYYLP
jgi:TolA-binding protein